MGTDRATIFALSSGPSKAGVAVIRISGPEAGKALEALVGRLPEPRVARVRLLRAPTNLDVLDRGLVLWMPGPASFTGEDVAELHIHGGRAVIAATLGALAGLTGLRPAEPGEFTRRAFANGRLDLTQVEGLADLIDAETEAQRRQAARQAEGALGELYEGWRTTLVELQARVEATLDFADEGDVPEQVFGAARARATALLTAVEQHLLDAQRGEIIRDGFRVVLAGPPNAGKSSLLNALARRDVAIVSPDPGTTRDALEVRLDIGGNLVLLTDTAGLRDGVSGAIEAEGVRRSQARIDDADLVLWVVDGAEPRPALSTAPGRALVLLNKVDLYRERPLPDWLPKDSLAVSAETGAGLASLLDRIRAELSVAEPGEHAVLTRIRHRRGLEAAATALRAFLAGTEDQPELGAEDLRRATHALGRITGRVDVEDVLEALFAAFCIGK